MKIISHRAEQQCWIKKGFTGKSFCYLMLLGYRIAVSLDLCLVSYYIMRENLWEYFTANNVDIQSVLVVDVVY